MSKMNRKPRRVDVEQVEAALRNTDVVIPDCDLVKTALLLEAGPLLPESDRETARRRMLRAFDRAQRETQEPTETPAGEFANPEVHTATVVLPNGHALIADLDHVDHDAAAATVRRALTIRDRSRQSQ